ncbi:MAG: spore coat protein [bacterium]|nr:spore coat protein [bacterium]
MTNKPLDRSEILDAFRDERKIYHPKTVIDGVEVLNLNRFLDDRGLFVELFRTKATHPGSEPLAKFFEDLDIAQVNYSVVDAKSTIKGLHFHLKQYDIWYCPPGSKMKVVLWDLRSKSPTSDSIQVLVIGGERDGLLKIPPGVAHGFRPLCDNCALIYFVTQPFDPDAPDEFRVPWDHPRIVSLWDVENA